MADYSTLPNEHPLPIIGDRLIVTLRSPIAVFLQGSPRTIGVFEGQLVNQTERVCVFSTMRMFSKVKDPNPRNGGKDEIVPITIRTDLTIPFDNLAGMMPMPKAS